MNARWKMVFIAALLSAPGLYAGDTSSAFQINGKPIQLAHYAKSFIGQGNVTVDMAPYKMGKQQGAIMSIHGVEGDWDGKAINAIYHDNGYSHGDYLTTYQGKEWHVLYVRGEESAPTYELWVPGVNKGIELEPSDGAAQATNPRAIFEQYQDQKKSAK